MNQHDFELTDASIANKVSERIAIPLDMNVWNFLARDVSAEATRAKELLTNLVVDGKVFCPLTFSVITELFKQNYESALRTATLMDQLSLNVCFALDKEIYNKEVRSFLQRFVDGKEIRLSKNEIYVPVSAFLGSFGNLQFPAEFPGAEEQRQEFTQNVSKRLASLKLTDIVNMLKESLPLSLFQQQSPPEYTEVWKERWEYAKGNKAKMREVEQDNYVRQVLIPELQNESLKLPSEAIQRFKDYIKSLPQNSPALASTKILEHMPALKNAIQIMTITGYDPTRKATMNDFFDIQMMLTPLAYADAFVSTDKWIRHLLTTSRSIFETEGAVCISSLSELITFLEDCKSDEQGDL